MTPACHDRVNRRLAASAAANHKCLHNFLLTVAYHPSRMPRCSSSCDAMIGPTKLPMAKLILNKLAPRPLVRYLYSSIPQGLTYMHGHCLRPGARALARRDRLCRGGT